MSAPAVSIENLHFSFEAPPSGRPGLTPERSTAPKTVLVGVVGSGNLEVLIEPAGHPHCEIHIETSARGFQTIWAAVLRDFSERHPRSGQPGTGISVSINDMGATPAVVSLRLDQAMAAFTQQQP
jgi:malonate decarboxylase delta subunit